MEEILASIRRIISEDDAPAAPQAAAAPEPAPAELSSALMDEPVSVQDDEPEEVLELTQRYDEPAAFVAPRPIETVGDIEVAPRPVERPAPRYEAPRAEPEPQEDMLVSDPAADTAAAAFGQLAQSLMMPREGRSLEDVVKELMKPMLKSWLDQNLPAIVEAQVRAEVERIARRGAR